MIDRGRFRGLPLGENYGWLDLHGTSKTVIDAAYELATVLPAIDTVFCSVHEWVNADLKGDWCRLMLSEDRAVHLMPDAFVPDRQVHGIKMPPKIPREVGATFA